MSGISIATDLAGVDYLVNLIGMSQGFFSTGKDSLALLAFPFECPSYCGIFKIVFDKVLIEIEAKSPRPGENARKFLVVLFATEKKGERADDIRLWRDVARGRKRRFCTRKPRKDRQTSVEADDQVGHEQVSFRLRDHENLWVDKDTPAHLVFAQVVLFFLRWELIGDSSGNDAWVKLEDTFRRIYTKECKRRGLPRHEESLARIPTDQMLLVLEKKSFRFPEGPRDFYVYVQTLIKRALAEEWKRRESETRREEEEGAEELERRAAWKGTFQSPEIEETKHFRHVTPAADRTSLPDPCDPEKAAGYLGISKSTAYEWIRRKKWGIQTDLLDGRRMIPLSEIKRLKRAMLEKEERIETIQKERGIRRASALRRLKRGLEKAQPESD